MAIVAMPDSLRGKRPNSDSFEVIKASAKLDVQLEGGATFSRRANFKPNDVMRCVFTMTNVEYATFVDFFDNDLEDGIHTISWTHFLTGGYAEYKILGTYQVRSQGYNTYTVSMNMEVVNVRVDDPTSTS